MTLLSSTLVTVATAWLLGVASHFPPETGGSTPPPPTMAPCGADEGMEKDMEHSIRYAVAASNPLSARLLIGSDLPTMSDTLRVVAVRDTLLCRQAVEAARARRSPEMRASLEYVYLVSVGDTRYVVWDPGIDTAAATFYHVFDHAFVFRRTLKV